MLEDFGPVLVPNLHSSGSVKPTICSCNDFSILPVLRCTHINKCVWILDHFWSLLLEPSLKFSLSGDATSTPFSGMDCIGASGRFVPLSLMPTFHYTSAVKADRADTVGNSHRWNVFDRSWQPFEPSGQHRCCRAFNAFGTDEDIPL